MKKPRDIAQCLALTMLVVIGLMNGIARPVAVQSTTVDGVSGSNSDSPSREDRQRSPDRRVRSMSTEAGGTSVSALSKPDESLAQVSATGTNGKIAFARSLTISEVYVVNADGSNQKDLTNSQGFDSAPVWSPDGSRIAFGSGRDGNAEIYMMNSDGSNQRRLTNDSVEDYDPVWSPDGSRIAFIRALNNNYEIYVINADGGGSLTQLTNHPSHDYAPTWSPDGSKIAFYRYQTNVADSQIYVMNADGSNQTLLTNERVSPPIWSPDGSRIAFSSARGSFSEIYVMNADGSNPTRLTFNIGNNHDPDWSPDGKKIVFTNDVDDFAYVAVMNADGSNLMRLTNEYSFYPVWSPDGSRIAFSSGGINVMNADGSGQTRITTANSPGYDYQPRWSPDSLKITFGRQINIAEEIYVMNGDGSGLLNLTNDPSIDRYPAWSPDGSRIAFVSYRGGGIINSGGINIWVMDSDGSNQTRLTTLLGASIDPEWSPDGTRIVFGHYHNGEHAIYLMNADGSNLTRLTNPGTLYGSPAWSPDGSRIAFARYQNGSQEIYVMNADGSGPINLTNSPGFDSAPAWSPDGSRIAFAQLQNPNTGIYVMNSDGSNQIRLTDNSPGFAGGPVWSPDSSRIAFSSNRSGSGVEIYVMNSDGSNQTRITHNLDAYNFDPDWQALPASPVNTIDDAQFFVRQHYLDFLNREPDAPGLAHWVGEITSCNDPSRRLPGETVALCLERKRTNTSAAFFLSPEFQYTGYFVYRLYKGSLIKNGAGRFPTYDEFMKDARQVAADIIQNNQISAAVIEQNKKKFAEEFTQRAEFRSLYDSLSNFDYVERLFQTTGINVSAPEKQALVAGLNNQTETRASVLQKVVDGAVVIAEGNQQFTTAYGQGFYEKEFNAAFVLMEYFGYLRRDPDAAGYQHWLDKLNLYGNYIDAEMVRSFILSPEYRARFGQP